MRVCISILVLFLFAGCCGSLVSEILGTKDARKHAGAVSIDASDTVLNMFTEEKRELLLRYLCSSAQWRVTRFGETPAIGGTLVALRRASDVKGEEGDTEEGEVAAGVSLTLPEGGSGGATFREESEGGCWHTTLHGYVSDFNADTLLQSRVMVRLEEYKPRSEDGWIRNDWFDKGAIGDAAVELNMYKPKYEQPGIESYLVLEGEGVWLEIYEQAESEDRAFTQTAVNELNEELRRLLNKGFSPPFLPPGSMIISDSTEIFIDEGIQPGIYMASGYVNPGKPGWIYFKVFNTETGVEAMYEMEQKRTIEYVGWSNDPKEKFFFDCEAWCKEGDWEHEYPARFELWFAPQDGSKERLLATAERRIYGWER